MFVLDLDGGARAHVARALDAHVRWCAVNAIPVPRDVRALRVALSASDGRERTKVDGGGIDGDDGGCAFLLSPEQVAHRLGVSPRSVRRLLGSGELPSVKIGGARRVAADDIVNYIEARKEVREAHKEVRDCAAG
jgi:excisionase family DNA binding protein